jgi:hypothetical protein
MGSWHAFDNGFVMSENPIDHSEVGDDVRLKWDNQPHARAARATTGPKSLNHKVVRVA